MIAHGAEHARLEVAEGHVIRKTADVQFGIAMTVRIAATTNTCFRPWLRILASDTGLVVEQKVRDRPGHRPSKRDCAGQITP